MRSTILPIALILILGSRLCADDSKATNANSATQTKKNDGHWQASCRRAPMQGSLIGDTVLALVGIEKYAIPEQRARVKESRELAEKWLAQAPLRDHQDRLWRLWGLRQLGGEDTLIKTTFDSILMDQRDDGGWAETTNRESDAYSTGQTLFMLLKTGVATNHPAILRTREFLLKRQATDGSWLAESHVKTKAQKYFENGDPYGEHQFLSTAATAWATAGLAQLLPNKNESGQTSLPP